MSEKVNGPGGCVHRCTACNYTSKKTTNIRFHIEKNHLDVTHYCPLCHKAVLQHFCRPPGPFLRIYLIRALTAQFLIRYDSSSKPEWPKICETFNKTCSDCVDTNSHFSNVGLQIFMIQSKSDVILGSVGPGRESSRANLHSVVSSG